MSGAEGRVVVITGAGGALGSAVAAAFANENARLALLDLREEPLRSTAAEYGALHVPVDLTVPADVTSAVKKIMDHYGRIDVLANIAGGFAMGPRLHETPVSDWSFMLDLNAKSVFLMCREVIPHMLAAKGGKIISVAARVANAGKGRMAPYSVAKSAVARLTESMAAEYRSDNINVNCIMPGTIDTPANRRDMPDADFRTWVAPAALADVICFLASDGARAVNGACVPVYGLT